MRPLARTSLLALALALALSGCATSGSLEKGARWVAVEAAPRAEGRRFALVVGVGDFEDPRFTSLHYAERDATAMASALEGFERVVQLTGDQTRRPTVLAALEDLLREASSPSDTVMVYVSSHGSLAQRPGGVLERVVVTRDARMDVLHETGILVEELVQRLDRAAARRRLLILALCHSGKGKSQLPDALAQALARQKAIPTLEARSEASIVLTACAFGETARESDELKHDVYTHFFLEGLEKGDLDGDGAVTASEAHDWARARTYAFTEGSQRPTSEAEVLGVDPLVLRGTRRGPGRPVIYSYARSADGLQVKVDGREKGALPGTIALEPGAHQLALVDGARGATLFSGQVALEVGERRDVAALLPPPPGLELGVSGVAGVPLGGLLRAYVPTAFGAGVRAAMVDLARSGLLAEATLSYLQGQGTAPGLDATLNVVLRELGMDVGVGRRNRLGDAGRLDGVLGGGALWLRRELSLPGYSGVEGTLAPEVLVRLRASVEPAGWPVFFGAALQGAVLWPRLEGQLRTEGMLGLSLEVGAARR
jgi:Caspase domain